MNQCIKYLSALNIITLANRVGNHFTNTRYSGCENDFEKLFKWTSFRNGFQEAKMVNKPIFLFIHKLQCPSCQKLKQKFSKSVRLMDLSDRFVMIKVEIGTESIIEEKRFEPDGKYVPRILFFTSDGNFIKEAYNKHAQADNEHKYFYKSPSQIIGTMLFVLREYSELTVELLTATFRQEQSFKVENYDMEDDTPAPTLLH